MKRKGVTRRQPPLPGGRAHGGYGLPPRLYVMVQREAQPYGVTIPFVITNAIAFTLKHDLRPEELM